MRVIFALAVAAFAGYARAQLPETCFSSVDSLQSCAAGGLKGSVLGAACCPQIQAMFYQCQGSYGIRSNLLSNFQYAQYWDLLIDSFEVEGCPSECTTRRVSLGSRLQADGAWPSRAYPGDCVAFI